MKIKNFEEFIDETRNAEPIQENIMKDRHIKRIKQGKKYGFKLYLERGDEEYIDGLTKDEAIKTEKKLKSDRVEFQATLDFIDTDGNILSKMEDSIYNFR